MNTQQVLRGAYASLAGGMLFGMMMAMNGPLIGVAIAKDAEHAPALGGYCPVAYVEMKKAVKGDPTFAVDYAGKHYVLANADAKKMFEANPSKYHVAYDGYCATAMSMGKKLESDPTLFTREKGVTYLFSSVEAKKMFDAAPAGHIEKADTHWASLSK